MGPGENLISFGGGGDRGMFPKSPPQGTVSYPVAGEWRGQEEKEWNPEQERTGNPGSQS